MSNSRGSVVDVTFSTREPDVIQRAFTLKAEDQDTEHPQAPDPTAKRTKKGPQLPNIWKREDVKCYLDHQKKQTYQYLLSLPLISWLITLLQDFLLDILRTGPLPNHISFIMDGNRRYAKSLGMPIIKGHEAGAITLLRMLYNCKKLGIKTTSAYAFSIENFNRPKEEVDTLTRLLAEKLDEIAVKAQDVKDELYGSSFKVVGDRSLISRELNDKITNVERMTAVNDVDEEKTSLLYICFPYTSRNDIYHAMYNTVERVKYHGMSTESISVESLTDAMYFDEFSNKCDLLIRTSGHTRLSDYMLWQSHENGMIEFSTTLWPNYTFLEFYLVLVRWSFFTSLQRFQTSGFSARGQMFNFVREALFSKGHGTPIPLEELPPPPVAVSVAERT